MKSNIKSSSNVKADRMPLTITPNDHIRTKEELAGYIRVNREGIAKLLAKHGAILFRGFDIEKPADFEELASACDQRLGSEYLGTSPRENKSGKVFSASELPGYFPIMQHCEMSFLPTPPANIFFFCRTEPQFGGETPICDFRKVYADLDPEVRDAFESRGVSYIRNYFSPAQTKKRLFELKKWNDVFKTTDRAIVEKKCMESKTEVQWRENDGLRLVNRGSAVKLHPVTNEKVWFNHTQVFHAFAAAVEYRNIHKYQRRVKTWCLSKFLAVSAWLKLHVNDPMKNAMHVTFGDGSEIPPSFIRHIQETIWKNLVIFKWKKGDVLYLDNFSTSHGRLPFEGTREVLVCWS
jgi:alpha-ketoglutarate-dependent taurine dioxygenase